jgi:hypothetical protein
METFLTRIIKLTASMPDSVLPVPAETPRSLTPNQPSENLAFAAGSALAGWAISGLKKQVLGSESSNGDVRPDSAPPTQSHFQRPLETPRELKGLGSDGDVDAWKDEVFDDFMDSRPQIRARQQSAPTPKVKSLGMKLPAKSKKSVVEQVVEEEARKSVDVEDDVGAWPGLEDWDDEVNGEDAEAAWGFDDD